MPSDLFQQQGSELVFPVFQPESPQAQAIYDLFLMVLFISAGIFFLVTLLIVIALWRGRRKNDLPEQNFGNRSADIFWLIGPVIITLWIAAISAKLVLTMNAVPLAHPPLDESADAELTVIAHQWWWEVRYHDSDLTAANEIHIPVGKKIRVKLESADVIHSFWVPQLARKMDVIPGYENYIWLEANRPGIYQGRCAEFCGNQHAWMNFKVYALRANEFIKWQETAAEPTRKPVSAEAIAGEKLFFSQTCANCHAISGTTAKATIGPSLSKVAYRKELGAGVLQNSTENLRLWMKDPQSIKPGCKMPNFNFNDQQVREIVAYLESLN